MDCDFFNDGLKFSCKRCGKCCGESPGFVYLSQKDLNKLCEYFNMAQDEFIKKYCRWVDYYGGAKALALNEKERYYCIFFNDGCTVYKARPVQCFTYPFWPWIIENNSAWLANKNECAGLDTGELHGRDEILYNRHEYLENKIITRKS